MKKSFIGSSFIFLLISIMFMGFVSAESIGQEISNLIDGTVEAIKPISVYLLGNASTGEILFAKTLLLLIITVIFWTVFSEIDFFEKKKSILSILSIGVGILSIRFFTEEMVSAILLQYTALGIAVSAGIPFVLFFFLVNVGLRKANPTVRRVAWIVFSVAFIGIWLASSESAGDYRYIYLVTAILSMIMMKMDGTFSRFFAGLKIEKEMAPMRYHSYAQLLKKIEELRENLSEAKLSGNAEAVARYDKRLGTLKQAMVALDGR